MKSKTLFARPRACSSFCRLSGFGQSGSFGRCHMTNGNPALCLAGSRKVNGMERLAWQRPSQKPTGAPCRLRVEISEAPSGWRSRLPISVKRLRRKNRQESGSRFEYGYDAPPVDSRVKVLEGLEDRIRGICLSGRSPALFPVFGTPLVEKLAHRHAGCVRLPIEIFHDVARTDIREAPSEQHFLRMDCPLPQERAVTTFPQHLCAQNGSLCQAKSASTSELLGLIDELAGYLTVRYLKSRPQQASAGLRSSPQWRSSSGRLA